MNEPVNPYAAPVHGIDRHVVGARSDDVVYVGFWKRLVAWIFDNILVIIVCVPIYFFIQYLVEGAWAQDLTYRLTRLAVSAVAVVLFWQFKQATPGKMLFSARIVDARTGGKASFGRLVLRYVGYLPSSLVLGLGFIWAAFDKQKRGWHDLIAGTLVVAPRPLGDRRRTARKLVPAAARTQSAD